MFNRKSRMLIHGCLVAALVTMVGAKPVEVASNASGKAMRGTDNHLIVHEWGTFTTIAGRDGVAVEWRPLNDVSDLPSFVYDANGLAAGTGLRNGRTCVKCNYEVLVRMETPVIYFYTDRETAVSVRVDFPQGKITEWYPQARFVYVPAPRDSRNPSFIDWGRLTVIPGAKESFPVEKEPSHYYPARETDASPLRVCSKKGEEREKFLFYRGVGSFYLPLAAKLEDGRVSVKNTGGEKIAQFIVFENRGGKIGYQVRDSLDGETVLERPTLDQTIDSLERDLKVMLVRQGLYEKEAQAMIKTWRDSWFEEGLRVFYIVPRPLTDQILPISIEPQPSELTRVLVGRIEMIRPEMKMEIQRSISGLSDSSRSVPDVATEIKSKHGRFAEPVLKTLLQETREPRLRARIQRVISYSSGSER